MDTSTWTRRAIEALEHAGLAAPGMVNIKIVGTGFDLEIADPDDVVHEVTIRLASA